jgi:hypothetical protein
MKVMAAPIPVGGLAMIAIQMRYIDFTAPPTHRSLASHIGQVIELSRRVSAAKNNVRKIAIQSLLAVMQVQSPFQSLTPRKTAVLLRVYQRMRSAGESSEEISAVGGKNAAVIFRSEVYEAEM